MQSDQNFQIISGEPESKARWFNDVSVVFIGVIAFMIAIQRLITPRQGRLSETFVQSVNECFTS